MTRNSWNSRNSRIFPRNWALSRFNQHRKFPFRALPANIRAIRRTAAAANIVRRWYHILAATASWPRPMRTRPAPHSAFGRWKRRSCRSCTGTRTPGCRSPPVRAHSVCSPAAARAVAAQCSTGPWQCCRPTWIRRAGRVAALSSPDRPDSAWWCARLAWISRIGRRFAGFHWVDCCPLGIGTRYEVRRINRKFHFIWSKLQAIELTRMALTLHDDGTPAQPMYCASAASNVHCPKRIPSPGIGLGAVGFCELFSATDSSPI